MLQGTLAHLEHKTQTETLRYRHLLNIRQRPAAARLPVPTLYLSSSHAKPP